MQKTVPVDRENLRRALYKRGLNAQSVSKGMGHAAQYLSNACSYGQISLSGAKTLEALYNVKPEEYAPDGEAETQGEWARAFAILIKRTEPNELKEIIKDAIREVLAE